jgi:hypothetical protein
MDFVNKFTGGANNNNNEQAAAQQSSSSGEQKQGGGFLGGIGDKLNSAAGGGRESEKNEDYLDKGMYLSLSLTQHAAGQVLTEYRRRLCPGEVPRPGPSGQRGKLPPA